MPANPPETQTHNGQCGTDLVNDLVSFISKTMHSNMHLPDHLLRTYSTLFNVEQDSNFEASEGLVKICEYFVIIGKMTCKVWL